ncbi:esterase/lipase family protein [Phytohabitans aurantiacus]|uniref:esterase/lipase family protein n=1 Tax=Phytohabitans aurantiacus TaxID=3016789 RepID=UPI002491495F|nr:alpha/beta fold hydrolase [Phytohabitans aurantiacus]
MAVAAALGVCAVGFVAAMAVAQGSQAGEVERTRAAAPVGSPDDTGFLPGANDFGCKPPAAHPNPVVLVHGTFENMSNNWFVAAPRLASEGFCVFAFNYGGQRGDLIQGTGPVATSAQQLSLFVDKVLDATGASKVDIVGHSQGGMMPRQYLRFLGGAAKVNTLVGLAPSNHGTDLSGLAQLAINFDVVGDTVQTACAACTDQIVGSDFITRLNADSETVPGVNYTVIATRNDQIVTPFTSGFLEGSGVDNITLQDVCANDTTEHVGISFNDAVLTLTLNALDPGNPREVECS